MSNGFRLQIVENGLTAVPKKRPGTPGWAIILEHVQGPFPDPDLWVFEQVTGQPGSWYIVNAQLALVIGIETPVTAGSALQLFERRREPSQLWRFEPVLSEPGCFYIASAAMGLVMGAKGPAAPGADAQALERRPAANQWWRVLTAGGAPAQPPAVGKDAGAEPGSTVSS